MSRVISISARAGVGSPDGMVVDQDQGGRAQVQRPLHHLADIDRRMVDGAARLDFVADQPVLAIEEQQAKLLVRLARHRRMQIFGERRPGGEDRLGHHPLPPQPVRPGLDQFQRGDRIV